MKTEIYFLENHIASLEVKKAEMERTIAEFEVQLRIEAGDLIHERLTLEKKLQELKANLTRKQDDYEALNQKQQNMNDFEKAWYEAKNKEQVNLSEQDEEEMKKIYREAMMMSHPDRFVNEPEKHEEANRLSSMLSEAYKNKNFEKVKELWGLLKDGLAFTSNWFTSQDENFFKKLLGLLKKKKEQLEYDISILEEHTVWTVRNDYAEYADYFDRLKNTMQENISMLKNEIKKYQR